MRNREPRSFLFALAVCSALAGAGADAAPSVGGSADDPSASKLAEIEKKWPAKPSEYCADMLRLVQSEAAEIGAAKEPRLLAAAKAIVGKDPDNLPFNPADTADQHQLVASQAEVISTIGISSVGYTKEVVLLEAQFIGRSRTRMIEDYQVKGGLDSTLPPLEETPEERKQREIEREALDKANREDLYQAQLSRVADEMSVRAFMKGLVRRILVDGDDGKFLQEAARQAHLTPQEIKDVKALVAAGRGSDPLHPSTAYVLLSDKMDEVQRVPAASLKPEVLRAIVVKLEKERLKASPRTFYGAADRRMKMVLLVRVAAKLGEAAAANAKESPERAAFEKMQDAVLEDIQDHVSETYAKAVAKDAAEVQSIVKLFARDPKLVERIKAVLFVQPAKAHP